MHMLKLVRLKRGDYHYFDRYVKSLETEEAAEGLVPDSTYFCLDTDRDMIDRRKHKEANRNI